MSLHLLTQNSQPLSPMDKIFEQGCAGTLNQIFVVDEPGPGSGSHEYLIQVSADGDKSHGDFPITFQKGPVKEVGVNGVQNEHLLATVIHRLQGFQSGPYACRENALALTKLQEAQMWLEARTKDRASRGVEGQNKV